MNTIAETDWILAEDAAPYGTDSKLLLRDETYELIGICMDVHRTLGTGFLEAVYKDAIEKELQWKGIAYEREKKYLIEYKGVKLPHHYFADFVINKNIVLEVKAQQAVPETFYAQVINYFAVSQCPVGLLVNFGEGSLRYKRFVFHSKKSV